MTASFIEVRGLQLHVRRFGGEGPVRAVLLHGWLDSSASFDGLGPLLAADGPAIALDFRGHGLSSWVGAGGFYHLPEYAADLDGALDRLGAAQPVRLVGHSLGGIVALVYASARRERVAHVTMLDAVPLTVEPREGPLRLEGYMDDLKLPRRRKTVASADEAAQRMVRFNPRLPAAVALHLARAGVAPDPEQGGATAWRWDPLLRAHSPLPYSEAFLQSVVERVEAPVLLLRAEHGVVPGEADVRARLAGLRRLDVQTVAGTSHHLHLEQPEAVARLVAAAWTAAGA